MGVPPNFTETQMLDCWLYSTISPIMCAYIYNICVCVSHEVPIVDGKTSRKPRQLPDPSPLRSHGPSAPSVMLAATADACPSQEIMKSRKKKRPVGGVPTQETMDKKTDFFGEVGAGALESPGS